MSKVLALNINGEMTYCTSPPDMRGKGRCNHIAHQEQDESPAAFVLRMQDFDASDVKKERESFIPYEGTEIVTKPYRMTEEEKLTLTKIENRMQLDQNIDGGYIELDTPLWNDMDKNYFATMSGVGANKINKVLSGEFCIVVNSEEREYPEGRVISLEIAQKAFASGKEFEIGTGVEGMNKYAEEIYAWQPTKDIYVLPYYMRIGAGDDISSDITVAYKYLLRNRADAGRQQMAYEALLNNSSLDKEKARYTDGGRNKSLADEFAGKGGIFRAQLSGSSIPYSARAIVSPSEDVKYGYLRIPPTMAIDIFRPTVLKSLALDGYSEVQIDEYFSECRKPQSEVSQEIRDDLAKRIANKRVCMNRQPSLHSSSFQSYMPQISDGPTAQVNPMYCTAYNMDFDGDAASFYGINSDDIIPTVDKGIGAHNYINTHLPRHMETSSILPQKDALWGLLNILDKRTN